MFSLKSLSSKSKSNGADASPSSSNKSNYIRTIEEDLAKLKLRKEGKLTEPFPQKETAANFPQPTKIGPDYQPETQLSAPEQSLPFSHFDSSQKESLDKTKASEPKNKMPSPFSSETFSQTQSPFDKKANLSQQEQPPKKSNKFSNKLAIALSLLLVLALLGGSIYYWWFFIKNPKKTNPNSTTSLSFSETENNQSQNLKRWNLDLKADKTTNKLAIEKNIRNLAESATSEKIVEIKLFSIDNQMISPQTFSEIFDFKFPASISSRLANDYSLFVLIENDEPRLGAAFKLIPTENLLESLKNEEEELFQNLKSFYLDKPPAESQTIFNSSHYKNADIRYFNFSNPFNTSLDYTVISNNQNSYFIFSTSKNSLRAILDYMSEK